MIGSKYISLRKFRRKVKQDGLRKGFIDGIELISRKKLSPKIAHYLIKRDILPVADNIQNLENVEYYEINDEDPSPYVLNIKNGYFLTNPGFVLDDDLTILNELLFQSGSGRRFIISKFNHQLFFEPRKLTEALVTSDQTGLDRNATQIDTAAPLVPRYNDNYFHWIIETVPKIRYIRAFEKKTNKSIKYIIPSNPSPWIEQTLDLLGVSDSKIIQGSSAVYQVNNLVAASSSFRSANDFEWIRRSVLNNSFNKLDDRDLGSNIYISRENAIGRRVVNEEEVIDVLAEFGFNRYYLEDQTVEQNATLFNNADAVVGAHGAGLSDIIFCNDATVIEFFGRKVHHPYKRIAETMGLNYESLYCDPSSTDIVVDTNRLKKVLKENMLETGN